MKKVYAISAVLGLLVGVMTFTSVASESTFELFTISVNAGEYGPESWNTDLKSSVSVNKNGSYSVTISNGKAERYRDLYFSGSEIPVGVTVTIDSIKLNDVVIGHTLSNPCLTSSNGSITLWHAWTPNKNLTGIVVYEDEHITLSGSPVIHTITINFTVSGTDEVTTVTTPTTTKPPTTVTSTDEPSETESTVGNGFTPELAEKIETYISFTNAMYLLAIGVLVFIGLYKIFRIFF
jgi:hypothetical protein